MARLIIIALLFASCARAPVNYANRAWLYDRAVWRLALEDGRCEPQTGCCLMPVRNAHAFSIRDEVWCCPEGQDVRCSK